MEFDLNEDKKVLDFDKLLSTRINDLWFDFKHALISLKRNQLFKAAEYIERLRDQILQIHTTMLNYDNADEFDLLSQRTKQKVMNAHFSSYTITQLKQSVINYLNLFVEILNTYNRQEEGQRYLDEFENLIFELKI